MFFFQAEDGIRDIGVTGVQTCALPIYRPAERVSVRDRGLRRARGGGQRAREVAPGDAVDVLEARSAPRRVETRSDRQIRSAERRVGKECRSRRSPYH